MNYIKRIYGIIKSHLLLSATDRFINKIVTLKLSYLSNDALKLLAYYVRLIDLNKVPGVIIETGCALGGSSILMTKVKHSNRMLYVYDSFGMIPEPSEVDGEDVHLRYSQIRNGKSRGIGDDLYYGYESNLLEKVKDNFTLFKLNLKKESVELIKGYYKDTLVVTEPVALAHIDCDWYESVKLSLEQITPKLVVGGYLIIDDYYRYSGCTTAVDEYFKSKMQNFKFIKKERLIVKRIS